MSAEAEKSRLTKILVADDDAVCRLFCSQSLAGPEVRIITADCGKQAISTAFQYLPDILIVDVCLPDMSGTEVIAAVQQGWPDSLPVPGIIGISADESITNLQVMQELGCRSILTKPFASSALAKSVCGVQRSVTDLQPLQLQAQNEEALRQRQTRFYQCLADELVELDVAITRLDWAEAQRLVHRLSGAAAMANLEGLAQNGRALLARLPPVGSPCSAVDSYLFFLQRLADVSRPDATVPAHLSSAH